MSKRRNVETIIRLYVKILFPNDRDLQHGRLASPGLQVSGSSVVFWRPIGLEEIMFLSKFQKFTSYFCFHCAFTKK